VSSVMADWTCASCGTPNPAAASTCAQCGSDRVAEPVFASQQLEAIGGAPAATATTSAPSFEPVVPVAMGDLVGGVLGGLVAAVVASGIWYAVVAFSGWQVGLVAVAVGWLVGQGVVFGAGGRASVPLVAASVVFTVLALGVSEYLIVWHLFNEALGSAGSISLFQPLDVMLEVVVESVTADPLTLLFWGIAVFEAVVIPFRAVGKAA